MNKDFFRLDRDEDEEELLPKGRIRPRPEHLNR